jgi:hypothetical protein
MRYNRTNEEFIKNNVKCVKEFEDGKKGLGTCIVCQWYQFYTPEDLNPTCSNCGNIHIISYSEYQRCFNEE